MAIRNMVVFRSTETNAKINLVDTQLERDKTTVLNRSIGTYWKWNAVL